MKKQNTANQQAKNTSEKEKTTTKSELLRPKAGSRKQATGLLTAWDDEVLERS